MQSERYLALSQDANKPKGICSVCFQTHQLHLKDRTLFVHGPRSASCSGSNKPPLSSARSHQNLPACTSSNSSPPLGNSGPSNAIPPLIAQELSPVDTNSSSSLVSDISTHVEITHPVTIPPLIKHIPKAARPACCSALGNILRKIIHDPNDIKEWNNLLHFAPSVLYNPPKAGAKSNLTSLIKNRINSMSGDVVTKNSFFKASKNKPEFKLSAAISSKMEDGNFKAALRLLCSEDHPADFSDAAWLSMQDRHPSHVSDMSTLPDSRDFAAMFVTEAEVLKFIRSFPAGSSGGPDGFRPTHLMDLVLCKTGGSALLSALTDFVNLVLKGGCPNKVCSIFFGGRLIAIEKKSSGLRPIAIGYTLRRLVSKCANSFAQSKLKDHFLPVQLGVAVSGGCEAAVHAARRFVDSMTEGDSLVKLDFANAFNSIRRDKILSTIIDTIPELYPLCHTAYACESLLQFGSKSVVSSEGVQQGDPLGPLLFCLTLQPILESLKCNFKIGYLDDVTLGGPVSLVNEDVRSIRSLSESIGLHLNDSKCEYISSSPITDFLPVSNFIHILPRDAVLLGAPLFDGDTLDSSFKKFGKIDSWSK